MFDWNDLRHFLAVARTGSTLAAARQLGVNQTTCARRVQALEDALGQRLFDRVQAGRMLTEAGRALMTSAEAVEAAARSFEEQAGLQRRALSGALRVTCSEIIGNVAVIPALAEFNQLYPEIEVEVLAGDRFMDLVAGEADIAIRAMSRPEFEPGLVIRKLTDAGWALYCSADYAARHGRPSGIDDLAGHLLIGGASDLAGPLFRMVEARAEGAEVRSRAGSLSNLFAAVRSGLGVAPLPLDPAEEDPVLIRCGDPIPEFASSVWLVAPERLRDHPRARAFMDFVASYMAARRTRPTATSPLAASS